MTLKQHPGIVPLGNECYIVLWGNLQAVFPWDGQEETSAILPGHANSSRRSVVLLQDGTKILVGLTRERRSLDGPRPSGLANALDSRGSRTAHCGPGLAPIPSTDASAPTRVSTIEPRRAPS